MIMMMMKLNLEFVSNAESLKKQQDRLDLHIPFFTRATLC